MRHPECAHTSPGPAAAGAIQEPSSIRSTSTWIMAFARTTARLVILDPRQRELSRNHLRTVQRQHGSWPPPGRRLDSSSWTRGCGSYPGTIFELFNVNMGAGLRQDDA